jgi:hypothetical protein
VTTSIRLIESRDAEALAGHLARDAEAFARWDPEHPPEYYTAAGQRARIGRLLARHADGELWPAVVLAGDAVIGQVTAQNLLLRASFVPLQPESSVQAITTQVVSLLLIQEGFTPASDRPAEPPPWRWH